jgi:hypothetical protein
MTADPAELGQRIFDWVQDPQEASLVILVKTVQGMFEVSVRPVPPVADDA